MVGEKFLLIVNQTSGLGRGRRCERRLLRRELKLSDKRIDMVCSSRDGEGSVENLARQADKAGYSRVIVAGGDGSCYEAANGLAMGNIPLAIIPVGTGNDFSKGLGIPQSIDQAFQVAISGKEAKIDLGRVNNRFFVNVVSFGFDAELVSMVPEIKRRFNGLPSKGLYLVALAKKLSCPLKFSEVKIGKGKPHMMLGLVVTNGPQYGGMFKISPKASYKDDMLNCCLIAPMTKTRLLESLTRLLKGTHNLLPEVSMSKISSLIVSSLEDLDCEVDGEIFEKKREYLITSQPGALRVIIPQGGNLR